MKTHKYPSGVFLNLNERTGWTWVIMLEFAFTLTLVGIACVFSTLALVAIACMMLKKIFGEE